MYDIKTIDELIEVLGGDTVVARWLGITQPAVAAWKARGDIPGGWHMRLYAEVVKRGKTIDLAAVFGLSEEDIRPLLRSRATEHLAAAT